MRYAEEQSFVLLRSVSVEGEYALAIDETLGRINRISVPHTRQNVATTDTAVFVVVVFVFAAATVTAGQPPCVATRRSAKRYPICCRLCMADSIHACRCAICR